MTERQATGVRIAAAVSEDGDQILPLADGPTVMILDTDTLREERHSNPGYPLKQNRRAATTEFLYAQGVTLVCAVPQTFCPVSHETARSYGMRFVLLPAGMTWNDLVQLKLWASIPAVEQIPDCDLFRPGR